MLTELLASLFFWFLLASKLPNLCFSTETKVSRKDSDSDLEELTRGPDSGPAVSSQPPRVALFPGVDASALKASLSDVRLSFLLLVLLKRPPVVAGSAEEKSH